MIYNIASHFQGLGDCLQFSTLPERLTIVGNEVYLYEGVDVLPYRNNEIKQLVWGHNPYIKGVVNSSWNCGDIPSVVYKNNTPTFLGNWESCFGISSEYSKFPKVYADPKKPKRRLEGVIELSGITLKYKKEEVIWTVKQIMSNFPGITFTQIISHHQNDRIHISSAHTHEAESLFEIWDLLCDTKILITLNSGIHSLAAAAVPYNKNLMCYCILPEGKYDWAISERKFVYPGFVYYKETQKI